MRDKPSLEVHEAITSGEVVAWRLAPSQRLGGWSCVWERGCSRRSPPRRCLPRPPPRTTARRIEHVGTFEVPGNLRAGEPADTVTSAEIVDVTATAARWSTPIRRTGRLGFVDIARPSAPRPRRRDRHGRRADERGDRSARGRCRRSTPPTSFANPSGELVVIDIATRSASSGGSRLPASPTRSPSRPTQPLRGDRDRERARRGRQRRPDPAAARPGSLQVLDLAGCARPAGRCATVDLTGLADDRARATRSRSSSTSTAATRPSCRCRRTTTSRRRPATGQGRARLLRRHGRRRRRRRHRGGARPAGRRADRAATARSPTPARARRACSGSTTTRSRPPTRATTPTRTASRGRLPQLHALQLERRGSSASRAASFEHEIVRAGHYPEARSENKGNEPEGLEVGHDRRPHATCSSAPSAPTWSASTTSAAGTPKFRQLLPTGIGPEGLHVDPRTRRPRRVRRRPTALDEGYLARPIITLFELRARPGRRYPYVRSADDARGLPIPWVALSGLSRRPARPRHAVGGQRLRPRQAYLYRIDAPAPGGDHEADPGRRRRRRRPGHGRLRPRGHRRPPRGRLLAGERRPHRTRAARGRTCSCAPTRAGAVLERVRLPASLAAGATSSGFEGVAVTGTAAEGNEAVYVASSASGPTTPPGFVKIGRYDVAAGAWTFAPLPARRGRVARRRLGRPVRDHAAARRPLARRRARQPARLEARVKRIYDVDLRGRPSPGGRTGSRSPVSQAPAARRPRRPRRRQHLGAGQARGRSRSPRDGRLFLATDNDGVDENYGETLFFPLRR